jgi:fructokinase
MRKGCTIVVGLGEALWDVLPGGKVLGGAPLNVACHVHALLGGGVMDGNGGRAVVASRVGMDSLGDEVVADLVRRGMTAEFLQRDAAHATSTVTVELETGQPTYTFAANIAWDHLEFTPEWAELARRCDAVCFGTLAQRSAPSRAATLSFLDAAPQAIRLFDVNLRQGFYDREALFAGCSRATLIKLNELELPVLAEALGLDAGGVESQMLQIVARYSLEAAILTRGERGTLVATPDEVIDPPVAQYPAAEDADAVGAGDACSAGILAGWLCELPHRRTAELANRLGAFVASRAGATPELPDEILASVKIG